MKGTVYLLPSLLGDTPVNHVIPDKNNQIIRSLKYFVVEDLRTARRFLKKVDRAIDIDALHFSVLNEHTDLKQIEAYLNPLEKGEDVGILSDAGCPGVADPGADLVAIAQQKGIKIVPLVGPSSILLSLMGSGFNGQRFCFHGYLPVKPNERAKAIKQLEKTMFSQDQTQIFIEAPYRNDKMLDDLIRNCHPNTKICVAANLTQPDEIMVTKPAKAWKERPKLHKIPAIFLMYK